MKPRISCLWWRIAGAAALGLAVFLGADIRPSLAQSPRFVKARAAAPKTVEPGKPFQVVVVVTIDKPFHIQANPAKKDYIPTEVVLGMVRGIKLGRVVYPAPIIAKVGRESLPAYEGTQKIVLNLTADKTVARGKVLLPLTLKYQGCNDRSCYPPVSLAVETSVVVVGAKGGRSAPAGKTSRSYNGTLILIGGDDGASPSAVSGNSLAIPGFKAGKIDQFMPPADFLKWLQEGGSQAGKADLVTLLLQRGGVGNFAGALGLIYLLGLALNLTPCVYPLIPITIGYFGKQAAAGARTAGLSVSYAVGIALMYSFLGILAALFGKVFGSQLANPWVLMVFAGIMFALGLTMFDRRDGRPIWELQLPSGLTNRAHSRTGYGGALLMGLMVGMVAAPCIGPIVVALIQIVSNTRSVPLGIVTFFTLGIGLATPYLLMGFGLIKALPRAGDWMLAVKHVFGLLLFGMGIYYLQGLLPAPIYRALFALFAVGSGIYLLFLDRAGQASAGFRVVRRGIGLAAVVLGIWSAIPKSVPQNAESAGTGIRFETPGTYTALETRLQEARAQKKQVLIDFGASWCAACKELDEHTFRDPRVVEATKDYVRLQFKLEKFESPEVQPFLKQFKISGLPVVVHLTPDDEPGRKAEL